jgi:hypothetical protein
MWWSDRRRHLGGDVGIGEVLHERTHLDPVPATHVLGDLVQQRLIACDENEIESTFREFVGHTRANALRRACDERPRPVLVREVLCHDCGAGVTPDCTRAIWVVRRAMRHPSGVRTSSSS